MALQRDEVMEFKGHLNSIEPYIKFAVELESDRKLAFLDTEIQHHKDGRLTPTGKIFTWTMAHKRDLQLFI